TELVEKSSKKEEESSSKRTGDELEQKSAKKHKKVFANMRRVGKGFSGVETSLFEEVMDTCTTLSRRVEHLELDKIAQALEITKLKRRVKKLERRNKGRMIAEMDQDANVVLEEAKEVAKDAKVDESVDIQGRKVESQAEIYKIDLEHANKVLSMQEDESE
nr:hypothetical protein [Tanacetum cinerariifolium]